MLRRCEDQKGRDRLDRIRARRRAAIRGPEARPTQPGGGWDSIRILGHQDADYDFHKFDLESDVALADKSGIDPHAANIAPFKSPWRKLLLYHGWADKAIPPGNTVNFYSAVLDKMGPDQE